VDPIDAAAGARRLIRDYLESHDLAVLATTTPSGAPQAALIGVAVTAGLHLIFDTVATTRKFANLRANPRVALAFGAADTTLQYEGEAVALEGEALARAKAVYFERWPDGRERQTWPGIAYVEVSPRWIRHSDFSRPPPRITELAEFP
jgi:general stress protein 26